MALKIFNDTPEKRKGPADRQSAAGLNSEIIDGINLVHASLEDKPHLPSLHKWNDAHDTESSIA